MKQYTKQAKQFYDSAVWKKCRAAYIKSVFKLCERCKQPGHILHHKKELTDETLGDPEIALGWDNLQYLCVECHNTIHSAGDVTRGDVMFDSSGNLVTRYTPGSDGYMAGGTER